MILVPPLDFASLAPLSDASPVNADEVLELALAEARDGSPLAALLREIDHRIQAGEMPARWRQPGTKVESLENEARTSRYARRALALDEQKRLGVVTLDD